MKRIVAKSLSYRVFSFVITATLSYAVTRKVTLAISIASGEAVFKLLLYSFHEYLWEHTTITWLKKPRELWIL